MLKTSPEALRIVAQLRERFVREYSVSMPRTPLVGIAKRFGYPAQTAQGDDTAATALYAALRGTPAGQLARIKQGIEEDVVRLYKRALQLFEKAASQRLYLACLGWRVAIAKALFDHPCNVKELTRYLSNNDSLVVTTNTDGEVSIDFRGASPTPFSNPGIIYTRPLCEYDVFQSAARECADGFVALVEQAIAAADVERDSRASHSRSTPREVGEGRVLSRVFKALTPEVAQACYQNLLQLAAGPAASADDLGKVRVFIRSEYPIDPNQFAGYAIRIHENASGTPPAPNRLRPEQHETVLFEGRNPIDAETCYLEHAARTKTDFNAELVIESNQPMRVLDACLDLSADDICESDPGRAAQLWSVAKADQAPITPAQFRAALRLVYPGLSDVDRYQAYAKTYPGKPDAVRRWANDDQGDHVPRDSFNLLLIRAGYHRGYLEKGGVQGELKLVREEDAGAERGSTP